MGGGVSDKSCAGKNPEKPGFDGGNPGQAVFIWNTGGLSFSLAFKGYGQGSGGAAFRNRRKLQNPGYRRL